MNILKKIIENDVWKKALRPVLFLLILVVILAPLYNLGKRHYRFVERGRIEAIVKHPGYVNAVVWGSSHAGAFNLQTIGFNGENLFGEAQDLFETYYKVRSLTPRLPNLKIAFITVSYFSFFRDNSISRPAGRQRDTIRIKTYSSYPISLPYSLFDAKNFLMGVFHPYIAEDHWKKVIENPFVKRKKWPKKVRRKLRSKDIQTIRQQIAQRPRPKITDELLKTQAVGRVKSTVALANYMLEQKTDIPQQSRQALIDLIRVLHSHGVRPIIYTPPYHKYYNRRYNKEQVKHTKDTMAEIVALTGVEYYDYSLDPEFENVPRVFQNTDHLTPKAGELLSLRIRQDMRKVRGKWRKLKKKLMNR